MQDYPDDDSFTNYSTDGNLSSNSSAWDLFSLPNSNHWGDFDPQSVSLRSSSSPAPSIPTISISSADAPPPSSCPQRPSSYSEGMSSLTPLMRRRAGSDPNPVPYDRYATQKSFLSTTSGAEEGSGSKNALKARKSRIQYRAALDAIYTNLLSSYGEIEESQQKLLILTNGNTNLSFPAPRRTESQGPEGRSKVCGVLRMSERLRKRILEYTPFVEEACKMKQLYEVSSSENIHDHNAGAAQATQATSSLVPIPAHSAHSVQNGVKNDSLNPEVLKSLIREVVDDVLSAKLSQLKFELENTDSINSRRSSRSETLAPKAEEIPANPTISLNQLNQLGQEVQPFHGVFPPLAALEADDILAHLME